MEEGFKEDEFLYLEYLMDYYQNPRNYGTLEHPTLSYKEGNPACDDVIRMDFITKDGRIEDIKFSGKGCVISLASASMLTEMIKGKTLEEAKKIGKREILNALGISISPIRMKCALLSLKVMNACLYGIHTWPDEEI